MPSKKSTCSTCSHTSSSHPHGVTKYVTKIVNTSQKYAGVSSDWKLDYYKFKNLSFAQVLKRTISRRKSNQAATQSNHIPVVVKTKVYEPPRPKSVKNGSDKAVGFKNNYLQKAVKTTSNKLSVDNSLPCHNRFHILGIDSVVESSSGSQVAFVDGTQVMTQAGIEVKNKHHLKAPMKQLHEKVPKVTNDQATDSYTKYDIPITTKTKTQNYKSALPHCATLRLWDIQNKHKFGFIPLGDLCLPKQVCPREGGWDSIALHKFLKNSDKHNFMGHQVTISSQLNPDVWDSYLQNYWDKQLPLLIRFGFPLDYNRDGALKSQDENHSSAKAFPEDIKAYLNEEISHRAIVGPFYSSPINDLHISPMMTREKPNAPHRRVIIDLSFPQGLSVNAGVDKDIYLNTPFTLKLPTIDNITTQVKALGRGCKLYKVDISRAFRHIKLDPSDYDLLGLRHDTYYVDTWLPFGYRNGSALFQRISDAVRHIMRQRQFDVINYIDDILGIDVPSKIDASFDALRSLLHELGFQISQKKLQPPTTKLNCLGIVVDTVNFTVSVPTEKLQEITSKCLQWRQKKFCNKKQLQSLLGSLLYISKCVRTSRFFLNRLLEVLRSMEDHKQAPITLEARRDINWFTKFLPQYNGVTFFDPKPINCSIELDANL